MLGPSQDDLFFRDVVRAYVEAPRFVRRGWLAAELRERLDRPSCRFVLLTGEPGSGKSSFVAQLADDNPDWPVFFLRRDERTPLGETSARSFLLRTGFQLAALHPELFDLEQVRIEVEQQIGIAAADADVVGARIERIRASPFHQAVIRVTQRVRQTQGRLTGMSVGEWITDPRLIELDDLQQMALLAPARCLGRLDRQARIVILVDALDELIFGEDEGNLLAWLANGPPLPANVRIVLSSRLARGQLDGFIGRRSDALCQLALSEHDPRVREDVSTYASSLVKPEAIVAALEEAGRSAEAFVAELTTRANGNIGYAAAVGRALDHALANADRRMLVEPLLRLDRLPDDIGGLFAFFLRIIQSGPGRSRIRITDPATGRSAVLDSWPELYHPILALLAIAVQPLTLDQVHGLTDTLASRAQLAQAIGWLEQFLDRVDDRYRLYHATFAEFLTAAATHDDAAIEDLWVDAALEHRRLSRVMEGEGWPQEIWEDSPQPREQGRRDYARLHYVTHLFLGDDFTRLASVIDDGGYGRGKLRFDPSTVLYSRDLDLAIRTARRWQADEAARPRHLLRLWRFKLLRATLSSYADRLPSASYAALALVGQAREAASLAELITDPERAALALAGIAATPTNDAKGRELAAALFRNACDAAARVDDVGRRSELVRDLLTIGRPSADDAAVRSAALTLARGLPSTTERAAALSSVARWLHSAGRTPDALAIRDEIEALFMETEDGSTFYTYVILSADLGAFEGSRDAAAAFQPADRPTVLGQIAQRAQASGALPIAATLRDDLFAIRDASPPGPVRARINVILAELRAATGDAPGAADLISEALAAFRADDLLRHVEAVRELARCARQVGLAAMFHAAIEALRDAAVAEIDGNHHEPGGGFRLRLRSIDAATALAELDAWEPALEIARMLDYSERGDVLLSVVIGQVAAKEFDRAVETAEEIVAAYAEGPARVSTRRGSRPRYLADAAALVAISGGLAMEGQWRRALEIARRINDQEPQIEAISTIAIRQHAADLRDEAAGLVARVMREVRLGDTKSGRDECLSVAGRLCIRAQDWQGACGIVSEIDTPRDRAKLQLQIVDALAAAAKLDEAVRLCQDIDSPGTRAEGLLAITRKRCALVDTAGLPLDTRGIISVLAQAREDAVREPDKENSARVLRSIATAFAELYTGAVDEAAATMRAAVEALNVAPRFQFRPTPWCDTAVTFAKLGFWDWAMQIATALVAHEAFDGCSALRDLAAVAAGSGETDRAASLLAQARENAPRIPIPPMRFGLLSSVAAEYARIGRMDEANSEDLLAGSRTAALMKIAVAQLECGRIKDALATIEGLRAGRARHLPR